MFLLTARRVAHLVVHGTSGSTSYEMSSGLSGGVLSTVDMVVQRRDGPRRLRDDDDDDDVFLLLVLITALSFSCVLLFSLLSSFVVLGITAGEVAITGTRVLSPLFIAMSGD